MAQAANQNIQLQQGEQSINLNYDKLRQTVVILRAVNHKIRQEIIKILSENEQMTVTALYVKLRVEQSVASQHLAILRRAKIVGAEREGKFISYFLNKKRLEEVNSLIRNLAA